jgi:hypothetical protein
MLSSFRKKNIYNAIVRANVYHRTHQKSRNFKSVKRLRVYKSIVSLEKSFTIFMQYSGASSEHFTFTTKHSSKQTLTQKELFQQAAFNNDINSVSLSNIGPMKALT